MSREEKILLNMEILILKAELSIPEEEVRNVKKLQLDISKAVEETNIRGRGQGGNRGSGIDHPSSTNGQGGDRGVEGEKRTVRGKGQSRHQSQRSQMLKSVYAHEL